MQFELFEEGYLTVSEVNAQVRDLLEADWPDVSVIGEVSNFKRHASGHIYFTLKDAEAQLRAVCFRREAGAVTFEMEDGMKVIARGRLTLYESYGQFQLVARRIEPAGVGELERAFRALCEKLENEGLFDPAHKRDLPRYPFRIAVVTSPSGAAIRDITTTIHRRWPCARVLLYPVRVQGEGASGGIEHALRQLAGLEDLDVVIVGRGGGSLEDLWAFNEENVARAIYECAIPVISAVGHETDFTIADFVADVRAPTPTAAAEFAVPLHDDVQAAIESRLARIVKIVGADVVHKRARLSEMLRSYALGQVRGQIERHLQAHDHVMDKLQRLVGDALKEASARLRELDTRLRAVDARTVLERGYSICSDFRTGRVIQSAEAAVAAGEVTVTFGDGSVRSSVKEKIDERRDRIRSIDAEARSDR